mgnify:CR=1 FL=1|tara:strand:+ start:2538 stop:2822 length:285 start_codon:yes stop_codon:yes gene_type:complete
MAGFLTRTKHLDKHVANRVRIRAKAISDEVKRDRERHGEDYKDIDGPPMYELAKMFARSADTDEISKWLNEQDTAFRDYVPRMVFQILKDNTYA